MGFITKNWGVSLFPGAVNLPFKYSTHLCTPFLANCRAWWREGNAHAVFGAEGDGSDCFDGLAGDQVDMKFYAGARGS